MLSTIKRGCDLGRLIIVFGAGETAESVIKILQKEDIKISHICDNDIKKQGKFFHGYNVLSASEIQHFNNPIVIVASLYFKEIEKQLKELGVSSIIIYKELYLKKILFMKKFLSLVVRLLKFL